MWLAESAKHLAKIGEIKEELGTDGGGRNKRAHLQPWGAKALGKTTRPKLLFVSS